MQESNRTEFKRELSDSFERAVVSFLNYNGGGEILIGIDDDMVVHGVSDAHAEQLKIVDRIRNNIRPQTLGLFDVVLTKLEGQDIIRVIMSCGHSNSFLHTIQERNLEPTEQFLESLELRQSSGDYNYAAYLLADENGVSVKIAVYAGTSKVDLLETREYGNRCLITATHRILDRLDSENRTFAMITAKNRLEKERVNSIALKEAVINAIVHNDYTKGVPLVEIYADKLVVTSCGGLVADLSEEDFFKCRSMPRNRELMRVFRDMELVEQIGSGMSRILDAYDRSVFELTPSFTVVTFPFEEAFITQYDNINGKMNDKINGKMKTLLNILKYNPTATIPDLAEVTGKSQSSISRELKEYQEAGLLRREGSRRNGRWIVV